MQAILDANVTDVYAGKVDIARERGMQKLWGTTTPLAPPLLPLTHTHTHTHIHTLGHLEVVFIRIALFPVNRSCTIFQSDFHTNNCVVS